MGSWLQDDLSDEERQKVSEYLFIRSIRNYVFNMAVILAIGTIVLLANFCLTHLPVRDTDCERYLYSADSVYALEAQCDDEMGTATVFRTDLEVPSIAEAIITGIDGNVTRAQEDSEYEAIAILTPNEYIIVYPDCGEDGMETDDETDDAMTAESARTELGSSGDAKQIGYEVFSDEEEEEGYTLIQVSSRKYAYATDRRPYHASYKSYRWYRQFYRATGYEQDERLYEGDDTVTSSYGEYTGETTINFDEDDWQEGSYGLSKLEEKASEIRRNRLLERIGFRRNE